MALKEPLDEINQLLNRSADQFVDVMNTIIRANFEGDSEKLQRSMAQLENVMASSQGLADMFGRKRILLESDAMRQEIKELIRQEDATAKTPIVPKIPFKEAISILVDKDERLESGAQEVSEIYTKLLTREPVRSATNIIQTRVNNIIANQIAKGTPIEDTKRLIQETGDFTRAYADTVYRTTISRAYTAGRFKQLEDPAVREIIGALEYNAILDDATRPGHRALDGFVAEIDDPRWEFFSPPIGMNCRCALRMLDVFQLKRKRMIGPGGFKRQATPAGGRPDPGFGLGRPDKVIYGG